MAVTFYFFMGRKTKLTGERIDILCKAIENGDSDQTACMKAGISDETLRRHKRDNVEFMARYKSARKKYEEWYQRDIVDCCKKSLRTLILGQEYDETKTEYERDPVSGAPVIKKQTVVTKKVLPNVTAIIFALTNRDPENWKNRQTNEITGNLKTDNETKVDLSAVPDDLLEQVLNKLNGGE